MLKILINTRFYCYNFFLNLMSPILKNVQLTGYSNILIIIETDID